MTTLFQGSVGGVRLAACFYLVIAVISLIRVGWRSFEFAGNVLMALGFSLMSFAESSRSPRYAAGITVAVLGLGFVVYELVRQLVRA